jgi:hypothetical protein
MDHDVEPDHLAVIQHTRATGGELRGYRSEPTLTIVHDPVEDRGPTHVQDLRDPIGGESVIVHLDNGEPLLVGRPATLLGHAPSISQ